LETKPSSIPKTKSRITVFSTGLRNKITIKIGRFTSLIYLIKTGSAGPINTGHTALPAVQSIGSAFHSANSAAAIWSILQVNSISSMAALGWNAV